MKYEVLLVTAQTPVTILTTHGDIDGSNYRELIQIVSNLHHSGTRNLLLDLADTPFMSSSGMVALHSIALMLNGEAPPDVEQGWNALHSMAEGPGTVQSHLKLLDVQPRVNHTLEISGLKPFYETFTNRETALASFEPERTAPAGAI